MKDDKVKLRVVKIELFGDTLVGKTAIINALLGFEFSEDLLLSIGIDKLETNFILNNGNEIKLIIWDTPGAERFRSVAFRNLRSVNGSVLMFDVTNYNSFENLNFWLEEISELSENIPMVLFGNKVDLPKQKWEVTDEQIKNFAKEKNLTYFEVSAKTRQGVHEGFSYIVNEAYKRFEKNNQYIINEKENQNIKIEEKISEKDNCVGKKKKNNK